jgi:transglutaminase-like putative cysteine protease
VLNRVFLKTTAYVVLVAFTGLTTQPLAAAVNAPKPHKAAPRTEADRYGETLNDIHDLLKELSPRTAMPQALRHSGSGEKDLRAIGPNLRIEVTEPKDKKTIARTKAQVKTLRAKARALKALDKAVIADFKQTEKHLKDKNLPAEILARHREAQAEFDQRKAEFNRLLAALEKADTKNAPLAQPLADLGAFFAQYPNHKTHTASDPNKLPWGSPKPIDRQPATTKQEFKALLGGPVHLAGELPSGGIQLAQATIPANSAPAAADLAETEDVQLTPAIRALAASLDNNPVKIHNWVRNNIEFLPTYGSIQGADMTLQTKRGNAFDTASLTIALLRAANIPARYVYGSIEVPADKVMNWVGGVTVPKAAQELLGQGGIPNMGVVSGGRVGAIRMEHLWVEAWVDFVPSRGAVNRSGDTWVPMDASFKQYAYTNGMNLQNNVPFDAQSFIDQIRQGAIVSEAEGWVQNVNQANIQTALTNYQNQIKSYVDTTKPNATVGDVLGTKSIVQDNSSLLPGTLPYKTVATGARWQGLPDDLRWKFQYNLYANDLDRSMDSPTIRFTQSTPRLAGKKITLSFIPATQADADLIASYLPAPHADGTPILPSELPSTLPGYLIRLKPELRVEGEVVGTGPAFTMGTELVQEAAYYNPAIATWETGEANRPVVGEYIATALDLQGISAGQLTTLKARLETTKAKLDQYQANPADTSPLQTLTKETLSGDLLYSAVLSYFAAIDTAAQVSARSAKVNTLRMPSFGNFGVASQVRYYFGVPRAIGFPGLSMDIDRVFESAVANDANARTKIAFMRALGGQYSAHEHLIPEQLFKDASLPANDPNQPQAVSAVKALAIAASQGQKIYTLNSANQAIHPSTLNQLALDQGVKQEIADALATGKEVTVQQGDISYVGFNGSGYIIVDPETGAGAYKISTGANGGWFTLVGVAAVNLISVLALVSILATTGIIVLPVLAGLLIYISLFFAIVATLSFLLAEFAYGGLDFDTYSFSITAIRAIVTTLFVVSLLALPTASLAQLAILLYIIFSLKGGGPAQ